jgi:hypothetical protein
MNLASRIAKKVRSEPVLVAQPLDFFRSLFSAVLPLAGETVSREL